jgi:hypothetical protein
MASMKTRIRTILAGLLFVVALPVAALQAQGSSLKDQLVGQWQLVSISINDAAPYGDKPTGSMLLDAGGHYSIIVLSDGGARNIAYYGTYTVDEAGKTATMHVAGSTRSKADGRDQKHTMTVNGNQLVDERTLGRNGSVKMTWQRTS